jgi:hypothetical protein
MRFSASRLAVLAMLGSAAIALSACSDLFGDSSEDLGASGTPFTQGLATAYTDLASQAGALPAPEDDGFFSPITNLFGSDSPNDMLTRAFQAKADMANAGQEPAIEAASTPAVTTIHDRLATALAAGKDKFPEQAARAQSDYDCWVLFGMVPAGAPNAAACKNQLDTSLPALEVAIRPAPPPMPAPPRPPPRPRRPTTSPSISTSIPGP